MRILTAALATLFALTSGVTSQELPPEIGPPRPPQTRKPVEPKTQAELREQLKEKLDSKAFDNAPWTTDLDEAMARARKEDKFILAYFSRSYTPCVACTKFEDQILTTRKFAGWSEKVVPFLHVTSWVDDQPLQNLPEKVRINGLPCVMYLDENGERLRLVSQVAGLPVTLNAMEYEWRKLKAWKELKSQVTAVSTIEAQRELLATELELELVDFETGQRRFNELGFSREANPEVFSDLVNVQFLELLATTPRELEPKKATGKKFVEMFRADRIPDHDEVLLFWQWYCLYAYTAQDVEAYTELVEWVRAHRTKDNQLLPYLRMLEGQLERLKEAPGK